MFGWMKRQTVRGFRLPHTLLMLAMAMFLALILGTTVYQRRHLHPTDLDWARSLALGQTWSATNGGTTIITNPPALIGTREATPVKAVGEASHRGVTERSAGARVTERSNGARGTTVDPFETFYPESARNDLPLSTLPDPYHINNRNICSSVKNLAAVFLLNSAPSFISRRMAVRQTWGNHKLYKTAEIRVVFTLGQPNNRSVQQQIESENRKYKDILQGAFNDSYLNLIHKTVLSIRWASEHCLNSKVIVKMDDDVFVNTFKFLKDTEQVYSKQSKTMSCFARKTGTSPIVRGNEKWSVGDEYFKGMKDFPFKHCNGFFIAMTPDLPPLLYETARKTPILRVDDVYLTGVLPTIRGDVNVKKLETLTYGANEGNKCFEAKGTLCNITAMTGVSDVYSVWGYMVK